MRVFWPVTVAAAMLIGLLAYGVVSKGTDTSLDDAVAKGQRPSAPTAALPTLGSDGDASLADHKGKVVVLNFWASWCEPCREEVPLLQKTHEAISAKGGVVLGVDTQDASNKATAFLQGLNATFPSLRDRDRDYGRQFGVNALSRDLPDRPQGPDRRRAAPPGHAGVARPAPAEAAGGAGMRLAALGVALILAMTAAPQASLPDIEDEVMCVECGTVLSVSNSPVAQQERQFIREQIAAGKDKEQIKAAMVDEYGDEVIASPEDAVAVARAGRRWRWSPRSGSASRSAAGAAARRPRSPNCRRP